MHWKIPLKNILETIHKNYFDCLETGNPEFAAYSAQLYCMWSFLSGKELGVLTSEMMDFLELLKNLRQEIALNLHKIHTQAVLNLQLESANTRLTGEVHDEEKMLQMYLETKAEPLIFSVYLYKMILSVIFDKCNESLINGNEASKRLQSIAGSAEVIIFYFYDTLAKCSVLNARSGNNTTEILRAIRFNIKKMIAFNKFGKENCSHKLLLMEAEWHRINDEPVKAAVLYDEAIERANANKYINELALIFELTGKFYIQQKREFIAKHYLSQAHHYYKRWGAQAKVKQMENQYEYLTEIYDPEKPYVAPNGIRLQTPVIVNETKFKEFDLYSIMKAATAISGETELSGLLEKLIRIAIENAGAQHGYLVLKKNNELFIEAQGSVNTEENVIISSIYTKGNNIIPENIINFVDITKENLVIPDAVRDAYFSLDAIVKKKKIRSILCMPILHQAKVIGLLYFENNLITHAFTPERIELLKILSGQMATSLQNALNEQKKMNAIMEREKLLAQINLHEQELLKTKLEIQEQTLNNISTEIHDNIGQTLSFIKLSLKHHKYKCY